VATRHGPAGRGDSHARDRFLRAALTVLLEQGPPGLTVRGVAEATGTSSLAVYTRFGGRRGILDALYERTFEMLGEQLAVAPRVPGDAGAGIVALAESYRRFALDSPVRYGFMFQQSARGFDPEPDLRAHAQRGTFALLVDRVAPVTPPDRDATTTSYLLWTTMHGLVSVELTQRARTPPPTWSIATTDEEYEALFDTGMRAMLEGLGLQRR